MPPQFVLSDEKSGGATAQQSLCGIALTYYAGTAGQKWIRNYSPGKLTLKTALEDSSVAGMSMYRNGTSFQLSSVNDSNITIPLVQTFVPASGISLDDMVLGNNTSNQYISSKLSPDNVNFSTDTAFFKYTSGNSNIVSFNDPDRKNYMTINGTGHTTVTVEHLIYGLTATADVIIYDATDYRTDFDENNVMYIVLGSKYMEIPSDPESSTLYGKGLDDYIDVIVNPVNTEYSHQMWRFAAYGSTPYYVICSMHSDNQVLYCYSDNSICTWTTSASTYGENYQEQLPMKALWGIVYDSTLKKNKIVPAYDTTKALYITSDNEIKATASSAITDSGYIWSAQLFINDAVWNDKCFQLSKPFSIPSDGYDIVVAVDMFNTDTVSCTFDKQPWDESVLTFSQVKEAVEKWNNISPCVKIVCKKLSDVSSDDYVICIIADAEYGSKIVSSGAPGFMLPVINYEEKEGTEANNNSDWTRSTVYICTGMLERLYTSIKTRQAVITHEIGHALKLRHVIEEEEYIYNETLGYYRTFPSMMSEIRLQDTTNNYTDSLEYTASDYITNYDKSALIHKWE